MRQYYSFGPSVESFEYHGYHRNRMNEIWVIACTISVVCFVVSLIIGYCYCRSYFTGSIIAVVLPVSIHNGHVPTNEPFQSLSESSDINPHLRRYWCHLHQTQLDFNDQIHSEAEPFRLSMSEQRQGPHFLSEGLI